MRDCAKCVINTKSDLNRLQSWILAFWSVAGSIMPLFALARSTCGRIVEKAAVA